MRRPKAAHTSANEVTDTVFHAPMFPLNVVAVWNACEPSRTRSPPAECARTFRRRYTCAEAHARARTHKDAHECKYDAQARIADPFLRMFIQPGLYVFIFLYI